MIHHFGVTIVSIAILVCAYHEYRIDEQIRDLEKRVDRLESVYEHYSIDHK